MKKRYLAGALALLITACNILTPVTVNAKESSRLTETFNLEGMDTGEAVVDESYEEENEPLRESGTSGESDVSANAVSANDCSLQEESVYSYSGTLAFGKPSKADITNGLN